MKRGCVVELLACGMYSICPPHSMPSRSKCNVHAADQIAACMQWSQPHIVQLVSNMTGTKHEIIPKQCAKFEYQTFFYLNSPNSHKRFLIGLLIVFTKFTMPVNEIKWFHWKPVK